MSDPFLVEGQVKIELGERLKGRHPRGHVPAHLLVVVVPDGVPVFAYAGAAAGPSTGVEL